MNIDQQIAIERTRISREIGEIINRYSRENGSNTPDFLIAEYLMASLEAAEQLINARERWYGREHPPIPSIDADGTVSEEYPK